MKGSGVTLLERLTEQGAVRDRGVANPTGGVVLTARADTLEAQLDYLRTEFGTGAEVDLSGFSSLTEGLEQVLDYCEVRDLVPAMPAHMLSEAEEAGALSRTERDALEEERMEALQSYLDFLPPERVEASGYSPYDYDRDFYLAQAEYLADRLPRAGWRVQVPDTPLDRDSLYHEGYVARFYAERGIIPGYLSAFDIEQHWNGWVELSGEGHEASYLLRSMEELYRIYGQLVDEDMSDYEKVKAIYKGVMARTEYDYDFYEASLAGEAPAGSKQVLTGTWIGLVEGSDMVCGGYADSVATLLDMAGIPNLQISGESADGSMGHAWNKVLLDGVWYNLDATWGDTSRNPSAYFLRSDSVFRQDGHGPYGMTGESYEELTYPAPRDYR